MATFGWSPAKPTWPTARALRPLSIWELISTAKEARG